MCMCVCGGGGGKGGGMTISSPSIPKCINLNYSRTSMARTLMARLPRLFRTRS